MKLYRAGIDIGSTTVKLAVLDEHDNIIYGSYINERIFRLKKAAVRRHIEYISSAADNVRRKIIS